MMIRALLLTAQHPHRGIDLPLGYLRQEKLKNIYFRVVRVVVGTKSINYIQKIMILLFITLAVSRGLLQKPKVDNILQLLFTEMSNVII
jgi:hypothetical protein